MRLEVSWIWSRMESMPEIVSRTTSAPREAIFTERSATSADSAESLDTTSIELTIWLIAEVAEVICCACCSAALARWRAVVWVSCAEDDTCSEVSLMVVTSDRSSSMA